MTLGAHLLGWLVVGLTGGGAAYASLGLRRRLLPEAEGVAARVVEAVVALSIVVLLAELLGVVGLFGPVGLGIGGAALIGTGLLLRFTTVPGAPDEPAGGRVRGVGWFGAVVAAAVAVTAGATLTAWIARSASTVRHGVFDFDSLDYHLPTALEWYQTGRIGPLHLTSPDSPVATYPADAELLHAIGMTAFDRDLLTPLLNLGWLLLALAAGWVAGRSRDRGPAGLAVVLVLLSLPVVVQSQPGSALTDIASLAALLAAVALLSVDDRDPRWLTVAGLAAGLAVGSKLTVGIAVAALTVVIAVRRGRRVVAWLLGITLPAGFWYLRNLILLGNPVPAVQIPGLPSQQLALVRERGQSVLTYLDDPSTWGTLFTPRLRDAYGTAWLPLLVLVIGGATVVFGAGLAGALRSGRRSTGGAADSPGLPPWAVAGAGLVAFVGYLATPSTAGGPNAALFATDLRYALPGLGLCLLGLVLALPARLGLPEAATLILVGFSALALMTPWRRSWFQPYEQHRDVVLGGAVLAAVLVAAKVGLVLRPSGLVLRLASVVVVGGLLVVALPVERRSLAGRYMGDATFEGIPTAIFGSFRDVRSSRVAVGGVSQSYPYAGPDLSNQVDYAGVVGPKRELYETTDCRQWREVLRRTGARWVVVAANIFSSQPPAQAAWTRSDRGARVVLDTGRAVVFRLDAAPDPTTCAEASR